MPDGKITNESALLARLADIRVPDERLDALEAGLSAARAARVSLAKYDLGLIEPASRFQAPESRG